MRRKYFGTDGFRGEANGELTAEKAFEVGRYLGYRFGKGCRIVIGKDTRRSGYMFEAALVTGIVSSGGDAYLLHVTTTPSVAFVARSENFDCGIMISASHNPFFDNGIKLFNRRGEKLEDEVLDGVERYLDGGERLPYAKGGELGRSVDYVAGRNRYIGYLISLGIHSFKGYKIGLDCANGSAWHIAKSVFDALGATTFVIGGEPNGTNINDGCGSTHLEGLQTLVKERGLDVGFAFDGDGDRCLCVDERGHGVDGDRMLYAYARYMQQRGELIGNRVIGTVMSNFGLERSLKKIGVGFERTAVGDRYVYERMMETGAALGGEQSGHIIFSKYACTGDGILTALKMMEVMIEKKSALSALTADMVASPQVLKNVKAENKQAVIENATVRQAIAEAEKRMGNEGRVLVRPSGTEPVIRVMAEGARCEECVELIVQAIGMAEREK